MDDLMVARNHNELSFEDMRSEEKMIIRALEHAAASGQHEMRIAELQIAAGWDEVDEHECPEGLCAVCAEALRKGNSKVRNNLRRLMRYGWIHRPIDGTYALTTEPQVEAEPPQPVVQLVIEPPQPVMRSEPLVQIRKKADISPNPTEVDPDTARKLRVRVRLGGDVDAVAKVKRLDCAFYGACLDQAIAGSWAGFSCNSCTAYALPDKDEKESDMLALRAMDKASEMLHEYGKVMRVRGVKPGADAKRTTEEETEDFAEAM